VNFAQRKSFYKEKVRNVWAIFQKYLSEMGALFLDSPIEKSTYNIRLLSFTRFVFLFFFIFSPLFFLSFLPTCGCYKNNSWASFGTFSSVVLTTPADVVLERMGAQCVRNGNWQLTQNNSMASTPNNSKNVAPITSAASRCRCHSPPLTPPANAATATNTAIRQRR